MTNWEELKEEIDQLPEEKIGFWQALKLWLKIAILLRRVRND